MFSNVCLLCFLFFLLFAASHRRASSGMAIGGWAGPACCARRVLTLVYIIYIYIYIYIYIHKKTNNSTKRKKQTTTKKRSKLRKQPNLRSKTKQT